MKDVLWSARYPACSPRWWREPFLWFSARKYPPYEYADRIHNRRTPNHSQKNIIIRGYCIRKIIPTMKGIFHYVFFHPRNHPLDPWRPSDHTRRRNMTRTRDTPLTTCAVSQSRRWQMCISPLPPENRSIRDTLRIHDSGRKRTLPETPESKRYLRKDGTLTPRSRCRITRQSDRTPWW